MGRLGEQAVLSARPTHRHPLGDDTDTVAAMAGVLCGAHLGESGIPPRGRLYPQYQAMLRTTPPRGGSGPPESRGPAVRTPMPADRDPAPCPACRLPGWLCVCAHAPRVATRTPLLLVVHVHDLGRTSNTARLLALAVRGAALVRHGDRAGPADPAPHLPAGTTPVVLFPGRGAEPLTPDLAAALPSPPALVVPDGSWRQAARMVKRLPLLAAAVKVALPGRAFAGSALRRNRPGHRMSTYEAVTQALAALEGEAVAGPLLDFYRRATDRMRLVRGQIRLGDVYGGLGGPGLAR